MARAAVVGDLHLGKGLSIGRPGVGTQYNSRILDQIQLLDWILVECHQRNVTDLILTGDVTEESKPDYYQIDELFKFAVRAKSFGIDLHFILGNHDLKRIGNLLNSPLDLLNSAEISNCRFYKEPQSIRLGSLYFTFLPFRDRRTFGASAKEAIESLKETLQMEAESILYDDKSVVVGHLALEGSIPFGDEFDDSLNELMCPLDMFHPYDEVWMGHVHKFQILQEKPLRAHIGSLDRSDFGETEENKYIAIIDKDSTELLQLPNRPLRKLSLQITAEENATEKVLTGLKELDRTKGLKSSLLKIEVRLLGAEVRATDRKEILQFIKEREVHHLSSFQETRSLQSVPQDAVKVEATVDPKEAIVIWSDQKEFKDLDREMFLKFCQETIEEGKG